MMSKLPEHKIVILMATYNGEKYLVRQIESIINQTFNDWLLIIRDDASTDNTTGLINQYAAGNENIIHIQNICDEKGARANFAALYLWAKKNLNFQYLMFCDQDDIWKPDKIERSLNYMQQKENIYANTPLLIYSDLDLIDENGESLNARINVLHTVDFNKIIAQNYCFGCTLLLNKQLIEIAGTISPKAENHDYWVALAATAFGYAFCLETPGIFYRQHYNNVTSQGNTVAKRFNRYTKELNKKVNGLKLTIIMLNEFYNLYHEQLDSGKKIMLHSYLESYNQGPVSVLKNILKYKILRLNYLQNVAFAFLIVKYFNSGPLPEN